MQALQTMLKHRPIVLRQQITPDLNHTVRTDRKKMIVECCVMQLAEGNAIAGRGLTLRIAVRYDVRRIEQHPMLQPTQRALITVCVQHPLAKGLLMDPPAGEAGNVSATNLGIGLYG